jgi:hypothetical protein
MVSNTTVEQKTGMVGGSMKQSTAVGSGSRPGSARVKIPSSNPSQSQMIRPKNTIEGTKYRG